MLVGGKYRISCAIRLVFTQLINALGSGFALVGLHRTIIPLTPAAIAEKACAEANLSNCDVGDAEEGLSRLTESLEKDSKLTFLGRVVGQGMLVTALRQRFLLQDNWARPASSGSGTRGEEIDKQKLLPPIFILGLPRTGTTFLHNLLIRDPAFRGKYFCLTQFGASPYTLEMRLCKRHCMICIRSTSLGGDQCSTATGQPKECIDRCSAQSEASQSYKNT